MISPPTTRPGDEISRRIDSAVIVFPQPDSPTSPRVRPTSSVKLTPSTARASPVGVKKLVRRWRTSSRGIDRSANLAARIEAVAQVVAEEVETHDGQENEQPRCQDPRIFHQVLDVLRIGQHVAPARARLLDAEPEERQRALPQNERGNPEGGGDDRVAEGCGDEMADDDPPA